MTPARRPPLCPRAIGPEACRAHGVGEPGRRACLLAAAALALGAPGPGVRAQAGASTPANPASTLPAGAYAGPGGAASVPAGHSPAPAPTPAPTPLPALVSTRPPGIQSLELRRADDGLQLGFVVAFELPRAVEEALLKGVPLHFTAQALLMRERWYWTDRRIQTTARSWRLTYQPLTRRFRVSQGGLAQNFDDLDAALAACGRASGWKVAESSQIDDDARHYLEFSFRLDTSLLPRPMQIGIGGQPDWTLVFTRNLRVD